jgi:hypothetical protein
VVTAVIAVSSCGNGKAGNDNCNGADAGHGAAVGIHHHGAGGRGQTQDAGVFRNQRSGFHAGGGAARLHRDFTQALQVLQNLLVVAVVDLRGRNAVVGVADRLVGAANLAVVAGRRHHARRIVLGAVDAQARGQPLHRRLQAIVRLVQRLLAEQRCYVGVDYLCHEITPLLGLRIRRRVGRRLAIPFGSPRSIEAHSPQLEALTVARRETLGRGPDQGAATRAWPWRATTLTQGFAGRFTSYMNSLTIYWHQGEQRRCFIA